MNVVWAVLRTLPAAVAAALVVLQDADVPSKSFWTDNVWLFYSAITVVGIWALGPAVSQAMRQRRVEDNEDRARSIELVLGTVFVNISKATGIPIEQFGLEAFLVARDRPLRPKALVPHGRVRLGAPKVTGKSRWTKGEGALGTCWEMRKHATSVEGDGAVAAYPIVDDYGEVVRGCVAADAAATYHAQLASNAVEKALADAAKAIWAVVR